MQKIKPHYQVRPVEGGWRIMWIFPDGSEEPVENSIVYPQRQNAYRRAKQLKETNTPAYEIHVRMKAQRHDCKKIKGWIEKNIGSYGIFVLDPLWDFNDSASEQRYIQFSAKVRYRDENRDPEQASFDEPLPVESEFLNKIELLRTEMPVTDLETSHHSFRP